MKTCPTCKTELPPDRGRSKGGKARWQGTTKADRSEAASKAARARWAKSENNKTCNGGTPAQ